MSPNIHKISPQVVLRNNLIKHQNNTVNQSQQTILPFTGNLSALKTLNLSFKGIQSAAQEEATQIAQDSLNKIKALLANGQTQLTKEDEYWVNTLQDTLGRKTIIVKDPDNSTKDIALDCRLSIEGINQDPNNLTALENTLKALIDSTSYKPEQKNLGSITIPVHNNRIGSYLKPNYTTVEFKQLFDKSESKGVFDVNVNHKTGMVSTCDVDKEENKEMRRQWVTDSIRNGDIVKVKHPADWAKSLQTLAKFYNQPDEVEAFKKAIQTPDSYRNGGPMEGVAHIFDPETLQRDKSWFNNKRLESHGLALKALCDNIIETDKDYGLKSSQIDDNVIKAIDYLANYFIAIDYPTAPSAGNWEETPFDGGLTWDTEAIRSGLESLEKLVFDKKLDSNPVITDVRERLTSTDSNLRKNIKIGHQSIFNDSQTLKDAISAGRERIIKTRCAESPEHRPIDASLSFVTTSSIKLADDVVTDVKRQFEVLKTTEKLVRNNGILRYAPFSFSLKDGTEATSPDSYLNLNYNIAVDKNGKLNLEWKKILDKFGSKDASEPDVFKARADLATPDKEAEWFMVSDVSKGYGKQLEKLLSLIKKDPDNATVETMQLVKEAYQKETEFINRAYARITPSDSIAKSNGEECPTCALPEAYQQVSTLKSNGKGGKETALLPGWNTPLTWAKSSLHSASEQYLKNLTQLEEMKILELIQQ